MPHHSTSRTVGQGHVRALVAALAAAMLLGGLAACEAPRNRGVPSSHRPESRLPSEGPRLGSADLVVASERAVAGIADVPDIRGEEGRTVIVMDRVRNETSYATEDFQIYLARIRAMLNQSGASRDLVFVEDRQKASDIRRREGLTAADADRSRPRYALTGTFYDMPRGGTNFHLLTFQLMDMESELVIWEGSYEVKL